MTESATPQTAQAESLAALIRQRDFMLFWISRFLDILGAQAQGVTIAWQVYELARNGGTSVRQAAFQLGGIGLAQFLPLFALSLFAGDTADRHDRRTIVVVCILVEIVCVGALAAMSFSGAASFWLIVCLAVVFGGARAFYNPASTALAPMLVPTPLLPRAIAWNSLSWQSASIVGPALGGLLCAISPAVSYSVVAVIYLVSIGALLLVKVPQTHVRQTASRIALAKEGLVYVWRQKIVFGSISLDLVAVLLGGATALLPVFAKDILHVGALGFGQLRSAPAIGATIVAVLLAVRPIRKHAGLAMFTGVAVFGAATLVFALSKSMILSVIALSLLGAGDMVSVFVRQSLVQIVTPDHMRGRVAAVSTLFIGASNELGEFESGVAARLLGPVGAAVFGGVGALIATGVWAKLFPDLRKADRLA